MRTSSGSNLSQDDNDDFGEIDAKCRDCGHGWVLSNDEALRLSRFENERLDKIGAVERDGELAE
jgi:hypothetical protein